MPQTDLLGVYRGDEVGGDGVGAEMKQRRTALFLALCLSESLWGTRAMQN